MSGARACQPKRHQVGRLDNDQADINECSVCRPRAHRKCRFCRSKPKDRHEIVSEYSTPLVFSLPLEASRNDESHSGADFLGRHPSGRSSPSLRVWKRSSGQVPSFDWAFFLGENRCKSADMLSIRRTQPMVGVDEKKRRVLDSFIIHSV